MTSGTWQLEIGKNMKKSRKTLILLTIIMIVWISATVWTYKEIVLCDKTTSAPVVAISVEFGLTDDSTLTEISTTTHKISRFKPQPDIIVNKYEIPEEQNEKQQKIKEVRNLY